MKEELKPYKSKLGLKPLRLTQAQRAQILMNKKLNEAMDLLRSARQDALEMSMKGNSDNLQIFTFPIQDIVSDIKELTEIKLDHRMKGVKS